MDSTAKLFIYMIFGALGMGYLVYARKQQHAIAYIAGIGLCVFPYFVTNLWLVLGIGLALAALPFAFRDW